MSGSPQNPEGGLGASASERLDALDQLYSKGAISATELKEGRKRILGEITGPDEQTAVLPSPAQGATPASSPGSSGPSGGGQGGGAKGTLGLPIWALGVIGGAVALVVIGIILLVSSGGSSSKDSSPGQQTAYVASIKRPLDLLNRSAVVVGKQLASTSEPVDLAALNRVAERQLDVVEEARSALAETPTSPDDARAQRTLLAAVSEQRTYVIALSRASKDTPSQSSLASANRARASGGRVLSDYATFFALEPSAPNAITGTDLTDVSGLRQAINEAIADQKAEEDRAAGAARQRATPAPPANPSSGGVSDTSAEADRIYTEIQRGDYTDGAAADRLYYQLLNSSDPIRGNAAFNAGVIRYANGNCSGALEAFTYAASAPGSAAQLAVRNQAMNSAAAGCSEPVYDLTH